MMYIIWIVVMIAAVILEAATFSLISIWFAVGALASVIAALLGAGTTIQMIVFFSVSLVLLAATRPILKKLLPKGYIPTNGELDLGRTAVVIEKIDRMAGTGRVRLDGVDWGAVSADGKNIEKGVPVTVVSKGAAYLTVQPAEKTALTK